MDAQGSRILLSFPDNSGSLPAPMAAAVCLIIAIIFFRLAGGMGWVNTGDWANFSPMAAIVLCGAVYFPKKWAIAIPLAALVVTDVALNLFYGQPPLTSNSLAILIGFGLIFGIGSWIKKSGGSHPGVLLSGAIVGSLVFYILTNSSVWLMSSSSVYPRTFEGWIQCQTIGTPGFPPSYLFLRNSLVGDLIFTGVIWTIWAWSKNRQALAAPTCSNPVVRL